MSDSMSDQTKIKCNDFRDAHDLIHYYDEWANTYDKDCLAERGYVGAEEGAKTLVQFLEDHKFGTSCRILDVGSGTGLVAEHLRTLNYTNVDALEPSERSNDAARAKGLYREFIAELLVPGKHVSIPSNTYDAAISIGVFTLGNVKADGMDEMARVVRSGGLICFSIRDDVMFKEEYGYEKKMAELCEHNMWKLLSKSLKPYHLAGRLEKCYMFVYQVL